MNAIDFQNKVKETFLKYFPNGFIHFGKYAYSDGLYVVCGLISDINDVSSKIRHNDTMRITFGINDNFVVNTETEIDGKIVVEFSSASIAVLPTKPYYAMHHDRIPVRKINNVPENVIQSLDKYFSKAVELVKEHASNNNLYNQGNIPSKYLEL